MNKETVVAKAKKRLGIADDNTNFDEDLEDFFLDALNRFTPLVLVPFASIEVTPVIDSYGKATVDLEQQSLDSVARITGVTNLGLAEPIEEYKEFNHILTVTNLSDNMSTLELDGLVWVKNYWVLNDVVPQEWVLPTVWYMMADFYDLMSSDKSKFSVYTEQPGARSADSMREESIYFETKADTYTEEHKTLYGA